jgi:hypothetical protein
MKPPPNMAFAFAKKVALRLSIEAKSCSSSDRSLFGIGVGKEGDSGVVS